ncbi:sll0787 family AIR synthase-like protein [Pseudomonas typographi]|uniref:sll0787 family AIR synthase-like protein n=1 Tax=Pseudomonas typographi TaxID=2715964 RepID=UPI0016836AAB|nr:sll0787 family AIR synthase-like protein [Pseudomonas typographi]MBD1552706.1 sll0787 family AIR synthase-like protein [Pseudomonas typographi]MBD1588187.1 sll0787 family AIR synthase-like protein [Pseudomonas typographi]
MAELATLLATLRETPALLAKRSIQHSARALAASTSSLEQAYGLPGDDCAALRCGQGYQLLAIEGMLPAFVEAAPWFAGWSAVMANVSDITAMGGRASAVLNAFWHSDAELAGELLNGLQAACSAYAVPMVGGHTSLAAGNPGSLAVAISGWANRLLSTLHARPGQVLAMAVSLDGQWHADAPYWKAFEGVPAQRLRDQLEVLPRLAEAGWVQAAKDISNAGILGTLLMLLEARGLGACVDLDALPRPAGAPLLRWLQAFPSYGFLLALEATQLPAVCKAFAFEGLQCQPIGTLDGSGQLHVHMGAQRALFWDLNHQPLTGYHYPHLEA